MQKPQADEHAPYYSTYISLVESENIIDTLVEQGNETTALLSRLPESRGDHRYAPDKWSIKQVVGHIADAERIFAYRALRIARGDKKPMAGFEQNDYITNGPFEQDKLTALIEEFWAVRRATVFLFQNMQEEAWMRRGVANDVEVSVRAIAWIIAGHELHHRAILKEKYGVA